MIKDCHLLVFPKIVERRGNLSFVESSRQVPFDIARIYYLYDVPGGESRGGHAHKDLQQVIIAISGSFDVELDDGTEKKVFHMRRSNEGLYLSRMIWRELTNFASGSVCLVLASTLYNADDYYRDYEEFLSVARAARG
jgi:hypothetical protein